MAEEFPHLPNKSRRKTMIRITKLATALLLATATGAAFGASQNNQAANNSYRENSSSPKAVISIAQGPGDLGMEIRGDWTVSLDSRTATETLRSKSIHDAVVYIEVDHLRGDEEHVRDAIKAAKDNGWTVYIESASWDNGAVRRFIGENFAKVSSAKIENVAARIEWADGTPVAINAWPTDAALEVGVPREEITEFSLAKAGGEGGFLKWFANAAYQANPGNRFQTLNWNLTINRDVLKVWLAVDQSVPSTDPRRNVCMVAWRGTKLTSFSDLSADALTLIGAPQPIFGGNVNTRIGRGVAARYANLSADANRYLCGNYYITGHSLGGAMAQVHAWALRNNTETTRRRVAFLEAYNPLRPGNAWFRSDARNALGNRLRVYCRNWDPVDDVPPSFFNIGHGSDGCDIRAPGFTWVPWDPFKNHAMTTW
jgi:hypothetical protein